MADGVQIEGGIYVSGDFTFNGTNAATYPAGYYELKINAMPYCYPVVIAYPQPSTRRAALSRGEQY